MPLVLHDALGKQIGMYVCAVMIDLRLIPSSLAPRHVGAVLNFYVCCNWSRTNSMCSLAAKDVGSVLKSVCVVIDLLVISSSWATKNVRKRGCTCNFFVCSDCSPTSYK